MKGPTPACILVFGHQLNTADSTPQSWESHWPQPCRSGTPRVGCRTSGSHTVFCWFLYTGRQNVSLCPASPSVKVESPACLSCSKAITSPAPTAQYYESGSARTKLSSKKEKKSNRGPRHTQKGSILESLYHTGDRKDR